MSKSEGGRAMNIPWAKPYLDEAESKEINDCLRSGWYAMGPRVKQLEETVKKLVSVKQTVAVNSGTAALDVALKILGIKPGDEVIVPAMTYIATVNAVLYQCATPVFADIEEETYNISPADIEKKITKKTKCIIAIDYAGQGAAYNEIQKIAKKHKLYLIEDGAPGFGGKYQGRDLCTFGDIATTSFHMAKIFTTIEGGMVFTNNARYAEAARIIRSQGEDPHKKYFHPRLGHNYRMSDLHAAIGIAQLGRFAKILNKRKEIAGFYTEAMKNTGEIKLPAVRKGDASAWFLYPVLVNKRDKVRTYLAERGIATNVSWPMPVYRQKFYQAYKHKIAPVAERVTKSVLCLPLYYEMTGDEQNYVVETLIKAVKEA
jgi:dTDP-4-amino-4,6-dideoxygalactose transaminase